MDLQRVELDGVGYVIIKESVFEELLHRADLANPSPTAGVSAIQLDRASLAEKLVQRRKSVNLSQAELARRAGIRPETLNRIERGKTNPDFSTVRKLVEAIANVEQAEAIQQLQTAEQTGDEA